jgi:hypothetical protein
VPVLLEERHPGGPNQHQPDGEPPYEHALLDGDQVIRAERAADAVEREQARHQEKQCGRGGDPGQRGPLESEPAQREQPDGKQDQQRRDHQRNGAVAVHRAGAAEVPTGPLVAAAGQRIGAADLAADMPGLVLAGPRQAERENRRRRADQRNQAASHLCLIHGETITGDARHAGRASGSPVTGCGTTSIGCSYTSVSTSAVSRRSRDGHRRPVPSAASATTVSRSKGSM